MDVVQTAKRLADEVLFPAALATDAAEAVPVELLDALAAAGLYGLEADLETTCAAIEALASGCLTTTFVWVQHLGAVRAAAASEAAAIRDEWLEPLRRGERRAGLALGGALAGPPALVARPLDGGWALSGSSAWMSGWGRVDVFHTAARTEDGRVVWAFVDAVESPTLRVEPQDLVALRATATVRGDFDGHPVPGDRVTAVVPYAERPTPPELLRVHACLPLGVAARCCRLLGPSPLDAELGACREALARLDPEMTAGDRAAAGELALRAAAALMAQQGSRSLLRHEHAQRLARESLFVLVYALRPASRAAVLSLLGAL